MIDILIISAYLIGISIVGLKAGKGIKTMRDYAIYPKPRSTLLLVAIMCGSMIGGNATLGRVDKIYSLGIIFLALPLGSVIDRLLTAYFIAPKLTRFYGMISVGEIMGSFYGKSGRIITGICGMLTCIGGIGAQIIAMGVVFHHFLAIPYEIGMLAGATIVIVYTSIGGIRTATGTDLIQLAILIIALPVICNILLMRVGGYENLFSIIPSTHVTLFPSKELFLKYLGIFLVFCIPELAPDHIQRFLMVKDPKQIKNMLCITALVGIPLVLMLLCISFSAYIINPAIESKYALPYIIGVILPSGVKGLAIIGMLAVIMSVAESSLNAASVLLVHDIVRPLTRNSIDDKQELNIAKIATLILGIGATVAAFHFKHIIDIVLQFMSFWSSTVIIPLIVGILGVKARTSTFLIAAAGGFLTVISGHVIDYFHISLNMLSFFKGFDGLFVGTLVNAVLFFSIHSLQKCKSENRNRILGLFETILTPLCVVLRCVKICFSSLKKISFSLSFHNIRDFSSQRVHYHGAQYRIFGIFAVLNYIVPYFMWSYVPETHQKIVIGLRIVSAMLCFFLIATDEWNKKLKPYLPLYWHFTLLFCLPFSTSYMLFVCHSSTQWMNNMVLSLFLLAVLVDWLSFIIILCLGVITGYLFYRIPGGEFGWDHLSNESKFFSVYNYLFAIMIGVLFSRSKEQFQHAILTIREKANHILQYKVKERTGHLEKALTIKNRILGNVSHEVRTPLNGIMGISENLYDNWDTYPDAKKKKLAGAVKQTFHRLSHLILNLLDLSALESEKMHYSMEKKNIESLIQDMIQECKLLYVKNKNITFSFDKKNDFGVEAVIDEGKIIQVLRNIYTNAIKFTTEGNIHTILASDILNINGTTRHALRIVIQDEGIGIPVEECESIFEPFIESTRTRTQAGGSGLGLSICKEIILAHQGKIWVETQEKGSCFICVIPVDLSPEEQNSPSVPPIELFEEEGYYQKEVFEQNKTDAVMRLVVIEEKAEMTHMLTTLPEIKGHKVITFHDLESACSYMEQNPGLVDIIIMEWSPESYKFVGKIRKDSINSTVRICAICVDEEDTHYMSAFKINVYLTKPLHAKQVTRSLKSLGVPSVTFLQAGSEKAVRVTENIYPLREKKRDTIN